MKALVSAIYITGLFQNAFANAEEYGLGEEDVYIPSAQEFLIIFEDLKLTYQVVEAQEGLRVYLCDEVYMLLIERDGKVSSIRIFIEGFENYGNMWNVIVSN